MGALQFEDLTTYDGECGYLVPNESVQAWRSYFKDKYIRRAAGISSGGEIGFLALLPTVRQELVLVDHSYQSLCYAMLKYRLLQECGWKEAVRLLASSDKTELKAVLENLIEDFPVEVLVSGKLVMAMEGLIKSDRFYGSGLRNLWSSADVSLLRRMHQKLNKVTFVHGSWTALADRGPFDLFYVSNAHQSGNGNHGALDLKRAEQFVKPGGYVCATSGGAVPAGWTRIAYQHHEAKHSSGMGWTFSVFQLPHKTVAAGETA